MSLTAGDLLDIRSIIKEELEPVIGRLDALENDIKEIYDMLRDLQRDTLTDNGFKKLSLEKKLLTLNTELLDAARQAGIVLPR